jgi:uncharacterized protein (DUF1697 family)
VTTWIAFFRGINVGGHHIVPMQALKSLLSGMGCDGVATYIQSGNVIFRHQLNDAKALSSEIAEAMESQFGFKPQVLLLTRQQLATCAMDNPFSEGGLEPKTLHLWFLSARPQNADVDGINKLKSASESFKLSLNVFYLHAPDGIGRSKLAAKVEKLLGVPATSRNWRTVTKVLELAQQVSSQEPAEAGSCGAN